MHERTVSTREAARVLLVDPAGCVLLLRGFDPARPAVGPWWFTPGGGIEGDESHVDAALREVLEETGLAVADIAGPIGERTSEFEIDRVRFRQHDVYFSARADRFDPTSDSWTELERRTLLGSRWWSIDELRATTETVYPETLRAMLEQVLA